MRQVFAPNDTCRFFFARPIANATRAGVKKKAAGDEPAASAFHP